MLRLARWAAVTCVCHAFVARDYSSPLYSAQSAARRWAARSSRFGNSAEPRRATTTAEPPESRTADARSSRLLTRDGVLPVASGAKRKRDEQDDTTAASEKEPAAESSKLRFRRVLVAGASRGVGREIVRQLVGAGVDVVAFVRTQESAAELEQFADDLNSALGSGPGGTLSALCGDAYEYEQLEAALDGCDAVVSTLGGVTAASERAGVRVDFAGNANAIIAAARARDVARFVLVSSVGCGDSRKALPRTVYELLEPGLVEKERAERVLLHLGDGRATAGSDGSEVDEPPVVYDDDDEVARVVVEASAAGASLRWTVIRPGGLVKARPTGAACLTTDARAMGAITYADVAALTLRALSSRKAIGQVLTAVDPTLRDADDDDDKSTAAPRFEPFDDL